MNYMEEDKAVRNFIIIFIIVLLLVVGIYFFTVFVNKDNEPKSNDTTDTTTEVEIDPTKAIVGTMLQLNQKDYYVILYKSDDTKASEYISLVSKYKSSKDAKTVLTVDLYEGMNKKYYDKDNTNPTASEINDLRFGDITLVEVNGGKIVKAFDSVEKIKKEFKIS